ncbi:MAG: hypothetical protein ACC628_27025, partial [Pirellulaceae bacterium]
IVLKAIQKNPEERYATAQDLAEDLKRFQNDEPIKAKRPTITDQLRKWSRRHVGVVWTGLAVSVLAAALLATSTALIAKGASEAHRQRQIADSEKGKAVEQQNLAIQERNAARRNLYYAEIVAGQMDIAGNNQGALYARLVNHLPVPGEEDHRDWEWFYMMSRCKPEVRTIVYPGYSPFAAWSPDGQYIGAPGAIWRAETGQRIRQFNTSYISRKRAAWSPDGKKFAWGMADDENAVYLWDRSTDNVSRLAGHTTSVWCVAWSPDGSQLATGSLDNTIKIWDVATKTVQWTSPVDHHVMSLAWSPDGKLLAVGIYWRGIQLWDAQRRELVTERIAPGGVHTVSWHPEGDVLAVCEDNRWYLLKREDWRVKHQMEISRGGAIAYSPDGSQIAVAHGETVTIWASGGETKIAEFNGHRYPVISVDWSPDGHRLVTAGSRGAIKLWDLDQHEQPPRIDTDAEIQSIAWLADNKTLVSVDREDGSSASWEARDGSLKHRETPVVKPPFQLSADRRLAAVHLEDEHAISILDPWSGATHSMLRLDTGRVLRSYALSGDGSRMVTQTFDDETLFLDFWDVDAEQRVSTWSSAKGPFMQLLVWADGGTRVAATGKGDAGEVGTYWRDHVHVFDTAQGKRIFKHHSAGTGDITSLAWSRDGHFFALGTSAGEIEVVDAENGRRQFAEKIHGDGVHALAWHPDGNRLACATLD